jgi:hypothetical protein
MPIDITALMEMLDPAELTVRAQQYSPWDEPGNHWTMFASRDDIMTTRLAEIGAVDFRPTAARRAWDAPGLQIVPRTGAVKSGDIDPIEAWFGMGEKEIQRAMEGAGGNAAVALDVMGASLPKRTDQIIEACWNKLDLDFFTAWSTGAITVDDPETAQTYSVGFQIPGGRYVAAATTLAAATNAFDDAIAYCRAAQLLGVAPAGFLASSDRIVEIVRDMPTANVFTGRRPTTADAEDWFSSEFGVDFKFVRADWTVQLKDRVTHNYTATRLWPQNRLGIIPVGDVGSVKVAPVYRAMAMAADIPEAGIDRNGIFVMPESENGGKSLKVSAQLNAIPWPNENQIYVVTGV